MPCQWLRNQTLNTGNLLDRLPPTYLLHIGCKLVIRKCAREALQLYLIIYKMAMSLISTDEIRSVPDAWRSIARSSQAQYL